MLVPFFDPFWRGFNEGEGRLVQSAKEGDGLEEIIKTAEKVTTSVWRKRKNQTQTFQIWSFQQKCIFHLSFTINLMR